MILRFGFLLIPRRSACLTPQWRRVQFFAATWKKLLFAGIPRRFFPSLFSFAERARSRLRAMVQAASPVYPEEIGTSLQGFDASQVALWLENMGYNVELIAVAPAQWPTAR
jgi:hypothetical protein